MVRAQTDLLLYLKKLIHFICMVFGQLSLNQNVSITTDALWQSRVLDKRIRLDQNYPGQRWVCPLFFAGQEYAQVGSESMLLP